MCMNILAGHIRYRSAIAVRVSVEDKAGLLVVALVAITFATQIKTELQRHIKPRQIRSGAEGDRRNIMHAISALLDHAHDLVQPVLAGIVHLQRTSGYESEIEDCKQNCVEYGLIVSVERAIDEY